MAHALEHLLGLDGGQVYNFVSGLGPFVLGLGFVGAWWRRHNCHVHKCWRLQWHPHPDHGHVICRKHHPLRKSLEHADLGVKDES